jgi:hypothetical protein
VRLGDHERRPGGIGPRAERVTRERGIVPGPRSLEVRQVRGVVDVAQPVRVDVPDLDGMPVRERADRRAQAAGQGWSASMIACDSTAMSGDPTPVA